MNLALVVLLLDMIFAVLIVYLERRNPTVALIWLFLLFLLPVAGFVLYLLLGRSYPGDERVGFRAGDALSFDHSVEEQEEGIDKQAFAFHETPLHPYLSMVRMLLRNNRALLTRDNGVKIYPDGERAFEAMLADVEAAREHVHLVFFIVRNDAFGRRVVSLLAEKARQGVEVRFLYDAIGGWRLPPRFFRELKAAGGEVAAFFPFILPTLNLRLNYRNHRKVAVIDGRVGYIGGLNIGEEYLGKDAYFGYWRDTHLKICGSAVHLLQLRFITDWNRSSKTELQREPRYFPPLERRGQTAIQVVSSGPDPRWNEIEEAFLKLIVTARKSICIQSPYFIPNQGILNALRVAALSGVDVRIMVPDRPDHPFVLWATRSFLGELLKSGVRAYTYNGGFLHSKTIVADGAVVSIGSANWDLRSFRLNYETNAFIYDTTVAAELTRMFEDDLRTSTEITLEAYRKRPLFVKAKEAVSRLFSPLL